MNLFAFDPGGTTGWAIFVDSKPVRWGQGLMWEPVIALHAEAHRIDAVVYERFSLYRDKAGVMIGNEFESAQVIGVLRHAFEGKVPVHSQPASNIHHEGKLTPLLERLVSPYAPKKHAERHARDALAHGLYFLHCSPSGPRLPLPSTAPTPTPTPSSSSTKRRR